MLGAGPGSLLDLPDVLGDDRGPRRTGAIPSSRGLGPALPGGARRALQGYVPQGPPNATEPVRLFHPEPAEDEEGIPSPKNGVRAWEFPEWFVTRDFDDPKRGRPRRALALLVHAKRSTQGRQARRRGRRPAHRAQGAARKVPWCPSASCARASRATSRTSTGRATRTPTVDRCDIPAPSAWRSAGTSGDLAELFVVCTQCGTEQSMVRATEFDRGEGPRRSRVVPRARALEGQHAKTSECKTEGKRVPSKLLVRSATNAWFPAAAQRDHAPAERGDEERAPAGRRRPLGRRLQGRRPRRVRPQDPPQEPEVQRRALAPLTTTRPARRLRRPPRRGGAEAPKPDPGGQGAGGPRSPSSTPSSRWTRHVGLDEQGSHFYAERIQPPRERSRGTAPLHRPRGAGASAPRGARAGGLHPLRGGSPIRAGDGDLEIDVHPAPLASHKQWVPAVENHGEGVFFALDGDHVRRVGRAACGARAGASSSDEASTAGSPSAARRAPTSTGRPTSPAALPLAPAHHAVSLECGYPSSSIRERVYAPRRPIRRIALHRLARRRGHPRGPRRHGARAGAAPRQDALELARLCSNDPVCAHHDARQRQRRAHPPGRGLPRLPAHLRDLVRAAEHLARPRAGGAHAHPPRHRVLQGLVRRT
jgi:hypothetical protein